MSRPWHVWTTFAACAGLVAVAVGWLSVKALQADANEAAARKQAIVEENSRLALWRMDSAMASLVAQETARPYFVYEEFFPADRAYGNMFNGAVDGNRQVRSPLATNPTPPVLLYFQFDAVGGLTSPQAGSAAIQASEDHRPEVPARTADLLTRLAPAFESEVFLAQCPALTASLTTTNAGPSPTRPTGEVEAESLAQQQSIDVQQQRGQNEYEARWRYIQKNSVENTTHQQVYADPGDAPVQSKISVAIDGGALLNPVSDVQLSMMKPLWWGSELLFVRRVKASGREFVQGCVLDWPALKAGLLADSADLLPHADLVPHDADLVPSDTREVRLLASLPVSLIPGSVPMALASGLSPVQLALVLGWMAMLVAAAAVAALLQGVLSLSERRAAFVSAVTHELRTPLTTFRMYSEMLAEGMVQDEGDRHRYLETLRVEADRLTHLVANVLAYAGLERGRPGRRIENLSVDRLLDIATERLFDRAAAAGFTIVVHVPSDVGGGLVMADPTIVEQILFNLVDNACKYAASAADKALVLSTTLERSTVMIRLCDHGPGISAAEQRRLFQPFRKSASEAAVTAPGVGLGLALSRRLARDMGGDLRYEKNPSGACFALSLPRSM